MWKWSAKTYKTETRHANEQAMKKLMRRRNKLIWHKQNINKENMLRSYIYWEIKKVNTAITSLNLGYPRQRRELVSSKAGSVFSTTPSCQISTSQVFKIQLNEPEESQNRRCIVLQNNNWATPTGYLAVLVSEMVSCLTILFENFFWKQR